MSSISSGTKYVSVSSVQDWGAKHTVPKRDKDKWDKIKITSNQLYSVWLDIVDASSTCDFVQGTREETGSMHKAVTIKRINEKGYMVKTEMNCDSVKSFTINDE